MPFLSRFGDLGLFAARIKSSDIAAAHRHIAAAGEAEVSLLLHDPSGAAHFWVRDRWGNAFDVVESRDWFRSGNRTTGGVQGAVIGVSDIGRALPFYQKVLGLSHVVWDQTGACADVQPEAGRRFRRVLLRKEANPKGAFSKLLGGAEIELVQCLDRVPAKLYADRYWGDPGFIHLCFDVLDMNRLKSISREAGFPFTVDSGTSFGMEGAAGRFCYVEDTDGTLIELVETHKVPVLKKLGWYIDLRSRKSQKPLPDWAVWLLGLSKVR